VSFVPPMKKALAACGQQVLFMYCGSTNGDGEAVGVGCAGSQMVHFQLGLKVIYHIVDGGNGGPRFDTHIGSLGLGSMPQADELHVGIAEVNVLASLVRFEGNALGSAGQEDGIVVKQVVGEGKELAVAQGEGLGLARVVAGLAHDQLLGIAGLVKLKVVVLEDALTAHRQVEAGVTADSEDQIIVAGIGDVKGGDNGVFHQSIGQGEIEAEGVDLAGGFAVHHAEGDKIVALLVHVHVALAEEAVQVHFIGVAAIGIFSLGQTSADGEKVVGMAGPIGRIALPEIFGIVCFADQRDHLCALVGDGYFDFLVFNGIKLCHDEHSFVF